MHHVKHVANNGPAAFVAKGESPYYRVTFNKGHRANESPRFTSIDFEIEHYLHPKYFLDRRWNK